MSTIVQSTALEAGHVISATPGTLLALTVYSGKGTSQFIQLHNAISAPADTSVPRLIYPVTTQSTVEIDRGTMGLDFSVGIYVCNSSTAATKTIGTTDCFFTAVYR